MSHQATGEPITAVIVGFISELSETIARRSRDTRVGSQNVPPPSLKNRRNSEGPGGAWRVSRVLAEFRLGLPRMVESFAFMQFVADLFDCYLLDEYGRPGLRCTSTRTQASLRSLAAREHHRSFDTGGRIHQATDGPISAMTVGFFCELSESIA